MSTGAQSLSVADVGALNEEAFVTHFAGVYEHSPWVPREALARRPFADFEAVAGAFETVMREASEDDRLALVRAHPELGGHQARETELTEESAAEQAAAGLDRLTGEQARRLQQLNRAYGERFGFPLVISVRGRDPNSILDEGEARLRNQGRADHVTGVGGAQLEHPGQPLHLRSCHVAADPRRVEDRREAADRPGRVVRPVATMIAIGTVHGHITGLRTIYGAVIIAGVVGLVLSPIFSRLRFFPPVVTGSVITIIGISLLPTATQWCAGGVGAKNFGTEKNIAFAAATLLLILLIYRFLPGFFSRAAILLGLIVMILIAIPFGLDDFSQVTKSTILHVPGPFHFGSPEFVVGSILSMVLAMLVIMTEITADILAIGEVVDRPRAWPGWVAAWLPTAHRRQSPGCGIHSRARPSLRTSGWWP